MNDRLEQIHKDWMNANMSEHGFFDSSKLAYYFYSLALEDVRKEAAKDRSYMLSDYCNGYNSACAHIIDFIDQLSK